jgi:hypothetical protein
MLQLLYSFISKKMENKIALFIIADDIKRSSGLSKVKPDWYSRIHVRPGIVEGDESRLFSGHDSSKNSEYYAKLDLHGWVDSEMIFMTDPNLDLSFSYCVSHTELLNLSEVEKMAKTLRRIINKMEKIPYRENRTCVDKILDFGKIIKAERLVIEDKIYSFPEAMPNVRQFFAKIINSCYEMSEECKSVIRFTTSCSALDLSQTVRLSKKDYPCPVLIKIGDLKHQSFLYEQGDCICISEAEHRIVYSIGGVSEILLVKKSWEAQADERLKAFYEQNQVSHNSVWESYGKTLYRDITINRQDRSSRSLKVFVEFENYDSDSEIIKVWTDRNDVEID